MTKQMLFSDEACEIISTFDCCSATTSNAFATIPGIPCMPVPLIPIRLTLRIDVTAFTPSARRIAFDADPRARMRRVEAVQDPHRNTLAERGQDRLVVQDLRAVVGELRGLAVGNLRQRLRARHLRRIRRHHAIDVGPDPDFVRIERRAEDRRRVVGPSAAERRLDAIDGRADEPGHDRRRSTGKQRREPFARARARLVHQRLRRAELVRRHEQLGRVDGGGFPAAGANGRGDERSREHLAGARDRVEKPRRQLVDHRQAETELLEPIESAVDVGDDGVASDRIRHDRLGGFRVRGEQALANLRIPVPRRGCARSVDERIGHAAHRGCDDGDAVTLVERGRDEAGGLSNALGGPDRGPAELHDDEHMTRSIIDETTCLAEALGEGGASRAEAPRRRWDP